MAEKKDAENSILELPKKSEEKKVVKKKLSIPKKKGFSDQEVDLSKTPLFFPEGFEKIFLTIYVVTLPYIVGLVFLFIYVAHGEIELFLALNEEASFLLTWLIGYEVIASFILLYIFKISIEFLQQKQKSGINTVKFKKS